MNQMCVFPDEAIPICSNHEYVPSCCADSSVFADIFAAGWEACPNTATVLLSSPLQSLQLPPHKCMTVPMFACFLECLVPIDRYVQKWAILV